MKSQFQSRLPAIERVRQELKRSRSESLRSLKDSASDKNDNDSRDSKDLENVKQQNMDSVISPGKVVNLRDGPLHRSATLKALANKTWKGKIRAFLDNRIYSFFMVVVTIYALFGDDLRVVAFTKDADNTFYGLTSACFVLFMIELLLSSIAKPGYFLKFYFWLDLVATLSLLFDIGWIWNSIIGLNVGQSTYQSASQLARAGRGARVGTRAGRIVRIVRLIRLIRVMQLYKHASATIIEREQSMQDGSSSILSRTGTIIRSLSMRKVAPMPLPATMNGGQTETKNKTDISVISRAPTLKTKRSSIKSSGDDETRQEVMKETKVGKKLSDLTTKRVILLVLAMIFATPLFALGTYYQDETSYLYGLQLMNVFNDDPNGEGFNISFNSYVNLHRDIRSPLLYLTTPTKSYSNNLTDISSLRDSDTQIVTIDSNSAYLSVFDLRPSNKLTSILNICRTFFICFILATGALLFSKDANDLVIAPIEAMMSKIKRMAKNPLEAAQKEEDEELAMEKANELKNKKKKKKKEMPFETQILEQTVVKIGALLALGFGEAGARIIAENMAQSGDVNPMIPGNKVMAIFGFCDIRQFTDTTEILQEDVMVFVNEVAEIVHGIVDYYSGSPNKNIGDAFLLVWKFQEEDVLIDDDNNIELKESEKVSQIADMSLLSFVKIVGKVNKSYKLQKYKENEELNKRLPNYSVKMGFGLHIGWAIEGAIGSDFKIDASYLSPNVNMAARLEAATKQFGVQILVSGTLYRRFTPETQKVLRQIDAVMVKGSLEPIQLYTCDLDPSLLEVEPPENMLLSRQEKKAQRVKARMKRNMLKEKVFNNTFKISTLFDTDDDIRSMRKPFKKQFYEVFERGLLEYLNGFWAEAKITLDHVQIIKKREDYPTKSLIAVMAEHDFKAPQGWPGYRALTEK